jgi:hypothetical protein
MIGDGFTGGQFQRAAGGRIELVCAYAGTDSLEDLLADVGFGQGSGLTLAATILSSRLRRLVGAGSRGLASQLNFALELMQQSRWSAGQQGAALYLTGHSLGGGLAALIAADTGEAAATISSPRSRTCRACSRATAATARASSMRDLGTGSTGPSRT